MDWIKRFRHSYIAAPGTGALRNNGTANEVLNGFNCAVRFWKNVLALNNPMKAYLITTGTIFALIAFMHLLKSIADWSDMKLNPVGFFSMAALGLLAGVLSAWAWRLLWLRPGTGSPYAGQSN